MGGGGGLGGGQSELTQLVTTASYLLKDIHSFANLPLYLQSHSEWQGGKWRKKKRKKESHVQF